MIIPTSLTILHSKISQHFSLIPLWWCKTNTTKNQPHQSSNTQRTENETTDVVIHQHSRKLLKMDILISETCWSHNKWNKIASDIKLVFHSSTIAMMHGPINIRYINCICELKRVKFTLSRIFIRIWLLTLQQEEVCPSKTSVWMYVCTEWHLHPRGP